MNVLVSVASRHHSTFEIAEAISTALIQAGVRTELRPPEEVDSLEGYDAVILGSGVYAGRWLPTARDFVDRLTLALRERPVWLFSSGPVGDPPQPAGDPAGVAPITAAILPREHRVFAGRLDVDELGLGEKLILKVVRARTGDSRDWPAIEAWARQIALTLQSEASQPLASISR
jgi:menaquinone-dependent protoporphyrinogen oxidase